MANFFDTLIIGAGPAGLSAGYELAAKGKVSVCILEAADSLGGLAKTILKNGMYFDLGGHRFFTKSEIINKLWYELMNGDFLVRNRLSHIYYNENFFYYPLRPLDALSKVGPIESLRILISFISARFSPLDESSFESWVSNRFGKRLFEIFFKNYTEKVWGIECSQISPEWAAQRIKNLSLSKIILQIFFKRRGKFTSLIEQFNYPKYGPGMMWYRMKEKIEEDSNSNVFLNHEVIKIKDIKSDSISLEIKNDNGIKEFSCRYLISSMALRDFFSILPKDFEIDTQKIMSTLRYRSLMTVILVLDKSNLFLDNWIYIHSENVRVGRIQNFNNWSPYLIPDKNITCLGLEYFTFESDELWNKQDNEIIDLASAELEKLGFAPKKIVKQGFVYRTPKAYPMYIGEYKKAIEAAKEFSRKYHNIQFIGRNGQHRYNNMDHSMLAGVYSAQNILGANNDVWSVNIDDYQKISTDD